MAWQGIKEQESCIYTQGKLIESNYTDGEQMWETTSGTQGKEDIYGAGGEEQQEKTEKKRK